MKQTPTLNQDVISVQQMLHSDYLSDSNIFSLLPVAAYVCDRTGTIVNYNQKAAALWGRSPEKGDKNERVIPTHSLYYADGSQMPAEETPVAGVLRNGLPLEMEVLLERADGSRRTVNVNVLPIKDELGNLQGTLSCLYDITEQQQTRKDLDLKTRELQDYIDNAAIGLHWVDANGIIKWANKAELDMLGYTKEEYIGHHISEFHVQQEKIKDILTRLSCDETLYQYESDLRCKDGSTRNVQITSNVFRDDDKFVHTRCFTIDVTAQKNLFKTLNQTEHRNRKLLQTLHTPLYTTDAEGMITMYNAAAAELWGREPEIGKDMWCGSYELFNPDGSGLAPGDCPMAVCLKERRPVFGEEILIKRPDGTIRNVAPFPQPLFDDNGNLVGAINMLLDVTEARRTENALRESEARYRELVDSLERNIEQKTADLKKKNEELQKSEERYHKMVEEVEDYAIILMDKNGIIQNWNKGAEKIKGWKDKEIIGKSFENFYLPEDIKRRLPHTLLNQARTTGKAIHEGWRRRKDGTLFWGSIVLTALHDEQGNIIGFSKVTRDLTERKKAEDKMRNYASQLEFQNRELEQFAYAASHDMKEPLRKIHLYNSSVAENAGNSLDEKSREYLNRSIAATRRMTDLIEDLLTYSKINSNEEAFDEVDMTEIVDEVFFMHKDELGQHKVKTHIGRLPVIRGIPFQLKQLFDNLVNNAIKYKHPQRDVEITISSELVQGTEVPEKEADQETNYHLISVIDNGIGFDQQFAEKMFEIFQRLNNVSGRKGSGIGLAICKKIVQNHSGFINASGKINEGARFDVYFPSNL